MRDRELYRTLLGVESPWEVTDVAMGIKEERITVRVELRPGAHLPCPACGRSDCSILDRRDRIEVLAKTKRDWLFHPENLPAKREARFEQS